MSAKLLNSDDGESLLSRPDSADGRKKTSSLGATRAWTRAWAVNCWKTQLTVEGRIKLKHLNLCIGQNITQLRIKWTIDIVTKYHSKIWIWSLFLKLIRDDALRIGIGIEFDSVGAVYEYDLSNKEKQLGTANYAQLTDDRSVRLLVSATGFSKFDILGCRIDHSFVCKDDLVVF